MVFEENTSIKEAREGILDWDGFTDQLMHQTKDKLKRVALGVAIIFLFVIGGFYHLYPLDRKTDFLMIVHEPKLGNFLVEMDMAEYENSKIRAKARADEKKAQREQQKVQQQNRMTNGQTSQAATTAAD